jgi:hypothetical protein
MVLRQQQTKGFMERKLTLITAVIALAAITVLTYFVGGTKGVITISLWLFFAFLTIYIMAARDFCFMFVREGTAAIVVKGQRAHRYVGNAKGYLVDKITGRVFLDGDDPDNILPVDEQDKDSASRQTVLRNSIHNATPVFFGIYIIGLWPFYRRHTYHLKWLKWDQAPTETGIEHCLIPRDEMVKEVYLLYGYGIFAPALETKSKLPLDISSVLVLEMTDLQTAIFLLQGNWLNLVTAAAVSIERDWVGEKEIEDITDEKHEAQRSGFRTYLDHLNADSTQSANPAIGKAYGARMKNAHFLGYDLPEKTQDEVLKATTLVYVADQEAKSTVIGRTAEARGIVLVAKATAKKIELEGTATAEATRKRFKAKDEASHARVINFADAIENFRGTTLVIGGGVMPSLPIGEDRGRRGSKSRPSQPPAQS